MIRFSAMTYTELILQLEVSIFAIYSQYFSKKNSMSMKTLMDTWSHSFHKLWRKRLKNLNILSKAKLFLIDFPTYKMASVLVLAFCSALIISLMLLIFYVLCLFRSMNKFSPEPKSIAAMYQHQHANSDSKNITSSDDEGEADTSTIVFNLPLDEWLGSQPLNEGHIKKEFSTEEMRFFQLPPRCDWSYYKFSLVDELSNSVISGGGESNSLKSDALAQAEWMGSRRSRHRHRKFSSAYDWKRQQFRRKNTFDMIRQWMSMDTLRESGNESENGNNTITIPDIRIEPVSLSSGSLNEKELLI